MATIKRFYHYCIPIYLVDCDGTLRIWFRESFSSKSKAELWLSGFRHSMPINARIGCARIYYRSYKPHFY